MEEDELFQYVKHSRLLRKSCCHQNTVIWGACLVFLRLPPFRNVDVFPLPWDPCIGAPCTALEMQKDAALRVNMEPPLAESC